MNPTARHFLLVSCLSVCMGSLQAQPEADSVRSIRAAVRAIDQDRSLRKVKLENEAFLEPETIDGGGELTGSFHGRKLVKIECWLGLSQGIETKSYYFRNGRLLFVYEAFRQFCYDTAREAWDYNRLTRTFEGRYYFAGGTCIRQLVRGTNRHEEESADPLKAFTDQAAAYRHRLAAPR
ncbi:MAG TPA: hypothetical protein VG870_13250 [Chitinophagaceae bacterium]|nr:hypothetical protein [Chitinophagaceae bacterium]